VQSLHLVRRCSNEEALATERSAEILTADSTSRKRCHDGAAHLLPVTKCSLKYVPRMLHITVTGEAAFRNMLRAHFPAANQFSQKQRAQSSDQTFSIAIPSIKPCPSRECLEISFGEQVITIHPAVISCLGSFNSTTSSVHESTCSTSILNRPGRIQYRMWSYTSRWGQHECQNVGYLIRLRKIISLNYFIGLSLRKKVLKMRRDGTW
jgi:hypothetical protein